MSNFLLQVSVAVIVCAPRRRSMEMISSEPDMVEMCERRGIYGGNG